MQKNKIISSLIWKFLERGGTQIVQFIIQIVLARLLLPDDYGVIAIVTVFIAIANVFVQTGFNTALIQQKEIDDIDLSSVFYLSLGVAFILYIVLFFTAPWIASFYSQPILVPVFRVLSLTLFFGAINSIQQAIVARNLEFKKYFFSSIGGITVSAIVGIFLAYKGFGVWALVTQQLVNMASIVFILGFTVKWRPKVLFSIKRLKKLFSYGWKLLCSALIDTVYKNIYDLVIGKKYTSSDLAYYNRGKQFPSTIVQNLDGAITSVMLPVLSKKQDDKESVKRMVRSSIATSSFIIFPICFGLMATAENIVKVVLTDKWLPCVPFLQILALTYATWPIHTANLQAINSLGRSDIYLKLEIVKKIFGLVVLILTIPLGLIPMAIGQVVTSLLSIFINSYPNKELLNYSYVEQLKDIMPSLFIAIFMFICVYLFNMIALNSFVLLIIQVVVGILIYIGLAYLCKLECFQYIKNTLKSFVKKEKI